MRKLIIVAILFSPTVSYAEEIIPIPKKRPAILSVSPAYIEELKNRGKTPPSNPEPELYFDDIENIEPSAGKVSLSDEAKENQKIDIITLLEHQTNSSIPKPSETEHITKVSLEKIPVPKRKPVFETILKKQDNNTEHRLVSFSLHPQQIKLNQNLESFLKNHALDLFSNNKNLKLDIQAYATSKEDTQNASIRIALARALEVRKFLLTNNIEPSRIKLSPLGQNENNNSDDRIDLVFIDISNETL